MEKLRQHAPGVYGFRCPGCGFFHVYYTAASNSALVWNFNGDMERPTFSPSLLNWWEGVGPGGREGSHRCHLFVRRGQIEFCADCSHQMAGQTVDMIAYEDEK